MFRPPLALAVILISCAQPGLAAEPAPAAAPAAASAAVPAKFTVVMKDGTTLPSTDQPLVAFGRLLYRSPDGARHAVALDLVDLDKTKPQVRQEPQRSPTPNPSMPPRAPAAQAAPFPPAAERRAAPDFTAKKSDGSAVKLSELKGRVVLVDFWATWCGPCVMEMPNVKRVYKDHAGPDFEIVGVSLDNERPKLDAYLKSQGLTWPQYFDGKGWSNDVARAYGVSSIPMTLLLDREGRIARVGVRGEALAQSVAALIAEKPAPAKPKKT